MLSIYLHLDSTFPHNITSYDQHNSKSPRSRHPCSCPVIMSPQTPCALQIPEILCEVFDHLESDPRTLFAACQVNKVWAEKSLNVLWRTCRWDDLRRLDPLSECRRQFYADKIRGLTMEKRPRFIIWQHRIESLECPRLEFPRLARVEILLTYNNWEYDHSLVPTLEEFRLHIHRRPRLQRHSEEDHLRRLPDCCPNLRKFCVDRGIYQIDFHRLEDYLKKFSKLRSVNLNGMSDNAMNDEVFSHLAGLPLSELHMSKPITFEMIDLIHERLPGRLFSTVAHIGLKMEWRVAATLVPTLTALRKLKLELVSADTDHKVFQAIGTLTGLRGLDLAIAFQTRSTLSREELLAIGKLHELRDLTISGDGNLNLDNSVTNDDLVSFLSSFPEAESMSIFAFQSSLIPSSATIALATTSTRLRHYAINAVWDMDFVQLHTPPLFPKVQHMFYKRLHYPHMPAEG